MRSSYIMQLFFVLFSFSLFFIAPACFCTSLDQPYDATERLLQDLSVVENIDRKKRDHLPLFFNSWGSSGYFSAPSARPAKEGLVVLSGAYAPPYQMYNGSLQLFSRLELGGNYVTFPEKTSGYAGKGIDRSMHLKWSFLHEKDGQSGFPFWAIGFRDVIGQRRFFSIYTVSTKTFPEVDLECSLGWGWGRINGPFAAALWTPFRGKNSWMDAFSLGLEYSGVNKDYHADDVAKLQKGSSWNMGFFWKPIDELQLSMSAAGMQQIEAFASLQYNLGDARGFFPKSQNPPLYRNAPLGAVQNRDFPQEVEAAFSEQGFSLLSLRRKNERLYIEVANTTYRKERVVRQRIEEILANLLPKTIASAKVTLESGGLLTQEYTFRKEDLKRYKEGALSAYELAVLSPLQDVDCQEHSLGQRLYHRKKPLMLYTFRPIFRSYFGSSTGKFQYNVGIKGALDGYLGSVYYLLSGRYIGQSNASDMIAIDTENPSQIINVRSDAALYEQSSSIHLDEAFLQKNWTVGKGVFLKGSVGYFETAYAGVAAECLYNPIDSRWAFGVEGALLLKRSYHGFSFQEKIRKLQGLTPFYVPYVGRQYFFSIYYNAARYAVDCRARIGQFLARDIGVRLEAGKTYSSGFHLGLWMTFTNGNDRVYGKRYFDKGFSFSIPLDFFLTKSSRKKLGYSMPARLRDVGGVAATGTSLYDTLYEDRFGAFLPH